MVDYKVYLVIVNHPNSGRMYVGYTRQDLHARLSQHLSKPPNEDFGKEIKRFGKESFVIKELQKYDNYREMRLGEKHHIKELRTYEDQEIGMNKNAGGGGVVMGMLMGFTTCLPLFL